MAVRDINITIRAHDRASQQLRRVSASVGRLHKGLTATRLAAVAAGTMLLRMAFRQLGQAIRKYTEFEKNLANVRTMLTEKTDLYIESYRKGIQDIAIEFGQATDVLSKGLYDLLSAGAAAQDGLDLLRVAAKAAVGGVTDTATSVDALTSVINSYQIQGRHAAAVTDLMFTAVRRGKLTYEQLANGIGNVALAGVNARVMLHELLAAISTITYSGLPAERSFTALRAALMAFQAPSRDAAKIASQYGIRMGSAAIETMGLAKAIQQLRRVPGDLLVKMFPKRSSTAILAMLNNMDRLKEDLIEMKGAAGAAEIAFQKLAQTPWFRMQRLQQVFQMLLIRIGEALMPLLEELSVWFLENKDSVAAWVKQIGSWLSALGKFFWEIVKALAVVIDKITRIITLGKHGFELPTAPEMPQIQPPDPNRKGQFSLALKELTDRRAMLQAIMHGEWPMQKLIQEVAGAVAVGVGQGGGRLAAFESRFLREQPGRSQDPFTRLLRYNVKMWEEQQRIRAAGERTADATERAADELEDDEGPEGAEF